MKKDKRFTFFWEKEPMEEMEEMRSEIRRMFEDFWKGSPIPSIRVSVGETFPVDVKDEGDKLRIIADLPGFEKKDINLEVSEDTVEISAKRARERQEAGETFFRKERVSGAVRRSFSLPCKVDPDRAKASFKDGVLEVELPKIEVKKEKKRRIFVK